MNFVAKLSNPPSEQVLREAESVIQLWGLTSCFPETVVHRLVSCFDSKFLLSQPRPPGFKRGKFAAPQIHRYLWYRQAAKALGWRDRQKFPVHIENLLKLRVWPDGEAETTDAQSVINHPKLAHRIDAGSGDTTSAYGAAGRVPKFGAEWGYAGDAHSAIGPPIGSSGEEQPQEHGPGSTSVEELVCERDAGQRFVAGSCSGNPASAAVTCSSPRANSCTGPHDTPTDAHDRDAVGWQAKRKRVAHELP